MANLQRAYGAPRSRVRKVGGRTATRRTKAPQLTARRAVSISRTQRQARAPRINIPRINLPNVTDLVPQLNLFRNLGNRIDDAASGRFRR